MSKCKNKKNNQLGMDPGTASHRLVRDLLFHFVKKHGYKCFQCGEELTRETFSVEHKIPWLDSKEPIKLFFDLENIAFSHKLCNTGAARQTRKKYASRREQRLAYNRRKSEQIKLWPKEKRREKRKRDYQASLRNKALKSGQISLL